MSGGGNHIEEGEKAGRKSRKLSRLWKPAPYGVCGRKKRKRRKMPGTRKYIKRM